MKTKILIWSQIITGIADFFFNKKGIQVFAFGFPHLTEPLLQGIVEGLLAMQELSGAVIGNSALSHHVVRRPGPLADQENTRLTHPRTKGPPPGPSLPPGWLSKVSSWVKKH